MTQSKNAFLFLVMSWGFRERPWELMHGSVWEGQARFDLLWPPLTYCYSNPPYHLNLRAQPPSCDRHELLNYYKPSLGTQVPKAYLLKCLEQPVSPGYLHFNGGIQRVNASYHSTPKISALLSPRRIFSDFQCCLSM